MNKRIAEQIAQLKRMGWSLIIMATTVTIINALLPHQEDSYWLSNEGKQGFYTLSGLFFFLGLYCFGALWRRRNDYI